MNPFIFVTPLISAFIGYATNWIAVIMLFRPYKEFKFGKFKLIQQGVIPKNQEKIAKSIGKTVSAELFSTSDMVKQVKSDEIKNLIEDVVKSKIDNLLNKDIASVNNVLPENFSENWNKITESLIKIISEKLCNWVESDDFNEKSIDFTSSVLENIAKQDIKIPEQFTAGLKKEISSNFYEFWDEFVAKQNIVNFIDKAIIDFLNANRNESLKSIIPEFLLEKNELIVDKITEEVVSSSVKFLSGNTVKDVLNDKLKKTTTEFLENSNLGMFASFLPVDSILEKMEIISEQIINEFCVYLEKEEGKEKIREIIDDKIEQFLGKTLNEYLTFFSDDLFKSLTKSINLYLYEILQNDILKEDIKNIVLEKIIYKLQNLKVDGIIRKNKNEIAIFLISKIKKSNLVKNEYIQVKISALWNILNHKKIGKLNRFFTSEQKNSVVDNISDGVQIVINDNLPMILHSFDIEKIVYEKVAKFPVPKLEKIIRDVANRELKYITIFGGVIGFVIGIMQLIFFFFAS